MVRNALPRPEPGEAELKKLPKLDRRKQVAAGWVRSKTTVRNRWLAERLHRGHPGNVVHAARAVTEATDWTTKRWVKRVERARDPKSEG
jgi:hypothetical protein